MNKKSGKFLARWFVSSLGLWIAAELLGSESITVGDQFSAVLISGLILAILNSFIRPLVVFLTLPAVLITLGIFMLVINALMVMLAANLYGPLEVDGFGAAFVVGIIIGLVNWLVSIVLDDKK